MLILLNTAVQRTAIFGVPVLQRGATARYVDVQIGHDDSATINWDRRIAELKVRLLKAAQITTTVLESVVILNAVILPAILFPAQFSKAADQAVEQLENLQKQFLRDLKLSMQGRKHKSCCSHRS